MKTLITPLQALRLAFGDSEILPPETISEADILAAEERWIVPALGRKLHDKLLAEGYPELRTEYLAAPVALFTRALIQPRLNIRTDRSGTLAPKSSYGEPADDEALERLRRQLLRQARTLLTRATEYLNACKTFFPEYEPAARCSIDGGILLPDYGTRTE
ncbi:MAG: hypothetical protein NC209_06490 [Alistipes sp.]|nr:hypothetical protein [Alistipes senegalensis]MCM1250772.1 hypothetical protein [Alistipes sp.]